MPPRSLKSIVTTIAFTAWLLGHDPATKIICASYGQQLSEKLARDCRKVMQSSWYRFLFPGTRLVSARTAAHELITTAGGYRLATSVGGSITGMGADYFIVDDPTKPEEATSDAERNRANEWAGHTLFTRHDNKMTGRIILVMQRLHEDDMIGHVGQLADMKLISFAAIAQSNETYEIATPFGIIGHNRTEGEALHAAREPLETLAILRTALGTRHFSAQYLQMPTPPGGYLVNSDWFPGFDPANLPTFDEMVQSWDTASKESGISDFSVCTTWGRKAKQIFLIHVLRKRMLFPDLKRAVIEQASLFNVGTVLIEDCSSGIALIQQLKEDGFYKLQAIKPEGNKVERFKVRTAVMEAGLVLLPTQAAWREDYLLELTMFPGSRYDDQVDSTSQALSWFAGSGGPQRWLAAMAELERRRNGIMPVDAARYTVLFDHPCIGAEIHAGGRVILRSLDGYYHASEVEWEGVRQLHGIQRVGPS
jgi:predicted phage terminase large subunit-like protein